MKGLIDHLSHNEIGGWIRHERSEPEFLLQLEIDGTRVNAQAVLAEESRVEADEDGVSITRFLFTIDEGAHLIKQCEVSVFLGDELLPPSPIKMDPSARRGKKNWTLHDIDGEVRQRLENTQRSAELQALISVVSGWFAYAVDRASALKRFEDGKAVTLRSALEASGNLGGALAHLMGVIQSRFPEVEIPDTERPVCSVVIPVHNKFEITYNCIYSISKNLGKVPFEIVLVDDLSSDETLLASLVFRGGVRIVRNSQNLGFVGTCNAGALAARGEYILFLNNDTLMRDDLWLDGLVKTFEDRPDAGIVGSRLLFDDGKLQECGGIIWRDGSGWNWGRGADPLDPKFRYRREVDYVSGAALMIRSSLFTELDGFDRMYAPAYYEDTDLCFRVRSAGYKVFVQPESTIIHLEGQSNGTDLGSGLKRYQVVNKSKFLQRWKGVLLKHQLNGENPRNAAERYGKRTALFIDDSILTPDRDAGSNAALEHILSLQRKGYKVVFVPSHNMAEIPPYTQKLEFLGVECIFAPHFWSVEDFLRRDQRSYDLIYLHRFSNADKYMNICRSLRPSAKLVYNVADLHSLRDERAAKISAGGAAFVPEGKTDAGRELDLVGQADVTIVHSTYERDFIAEHNARANVQVVGWRVGTAREVNGFESRRDIAFIGGFRHHPNVDAVLWYLKNVHPLVHKVDPEIKFKIVGSNLPREIASLQTPGVEAVGYVEDIDALVCGLRLTVAPLRYGAGIKGKVLTSLAQGTPCVMSSIAAEGIAIPESLAMCVCDDPDRIAQSILKLYHDEKIWAGICWDGIEIIDHNFSQQAIDTQMDHVLRYVDP